MSIEWLLAKTTGDVTQKRPPGKSREQDGLSDKNHGLRSSEPKQAEDRDKESLHKAVCSSSANIQNRASETIFRCRCNYAGTINPVKADFKLLRTDNNGVAYFECPNCKRRFQYELTTGQIKIQKGLLGVLLGKLS